MIDSWEKSYDSHSEPLLVNAGTIGPRLHRPWAVKVRRAVAIMGGRNLLKDGSTVENCSQMCHFCTT